MKRRRALAWSAIILLAGFPGCRREPTTPAFTPGLGEIMTLTQMRHAKLWLAGQAGNWPLATYELDELREGMQDAATFHPAHKDAPLPIPALIDKIMPAPLSQLEQTISAHDKRAFTQAFEASTEPCNSCRGATNFGFNVVPRPTPIPSATQSSAPPP